jgi:hypothetical protein
MQRNEVKLKPLVTPADYTRFRLPGLNLPVDFEPNTKPKILRVEVADGVATTYIQEPQGSGKDLLQTALREAQIREGFIGYVFDFLVLLLVVHSNHVGCRC